MLACSVGTFAGSRISDKANGDGDLVSMLPQLEATIATVKLQQESDKLGGIGLYLQVSSDLQ